MKKFISLLMVLMLVFAFSACSGSGSSGGEEDGQNPVMNYVGPYVCGRAYVVVTAEGNDGASAVVTWSSSAWEHSTWTMSGTFDEKTLTFEYNDGIRTDYVYGEDGEVASQEDVYTDGHGTMVFSEGDELSMTWQDDKENVAQDMVFVFADKLPEDAEEVGLANPWEDVDSAADAGEKAGLDQFEYGEGQTISLGTVQGETFRYSDAIAEVQLPIGAVEMTIRKGTLLAAGPYADISGDYNEYKYSWEQDVDGVAVQCYGNREGEATKSIWSDDFYAYAILAYGAGGDTDYGLGADDVATLVSNIK